MNLLDLGELYIAATGSTASDSKTDISDLSLTVKFSASTVDCTSLVRQNTPKKIDFYLPSEATEGSSYRIVIKSNYVNGTTKRKEPVYTYNDVVTVAA